ncbi:FtsX-like permease family protein [Ligilactobacillus cholophilus]|uniref:FtsX-like permease family protein n=1 Tax=Ligilactobacillus cholophilus TaxID=3050131 RepID=UPI0025B22240|nr:FtsX-like permease family protein [Ligilactobacillus cholophilus]
MTYFKLAISGIWNNKKQYFPFIFASSILVAFNYIILSIKNNASIVHAELGTQLIGLVRIVDYFAIIITFAFSIYINKILNKNEGQELGLYSMLGFTKSNLRILIFIREVICYFASIIIGIILGMNFNYFAFLVLKKILNTGQFVYQNSFADILKTCILFASIFGIMIIIRFINLKKVNPIELWYSTNKNEKEPRTPIISGVIGIILLGLGYYIAINTKPNMAAIIKFTFAILLVVCGTYLVFTSFSILLLKFLQKRKNFYYQPNHFIAISGMLHRMRENGASLASICLLCTSVIVIMISGVSMAVGKSNLLKLWNPYDVIISTPKQFNNQQIKTIKTTAEKNHIQITDWQKSKMSTPIYGSFVNQKFDYSNLNTAKYQLSLIPLSDYNRVTHDHIKLKKHEALIYSPDKNVEGKISINGFQLKTKSLKNFKLYFNYQHAIFQPVFIIVKNQQLCTEITRQPMLSLNFFNSKGKNKDQIKFIKQMQEKLKLDNTEISSKAELSVILNQMYGGFLFLASILSLILLIVTVMMIYYKQLSEGYEDQSRFQMMQNVGLTDKETSKAIHSQVMMVFALPIIGAVINSLFAFPALKSILKLFSIYSFSLVLKVSGIVILIIILSYISIYLLTTCVYHQIINQKNSNIK